MFLEMITAFLLDIAMVFLGLYVSGTNFYCINGMLHAAAMLAGLVTFRLTSKALRPKPLPDIPYNQEAATKLFGDIPEMMAYVRRNKRIFVWPRVH